jgi:hypothetical protein
VPYLFTLNVIFPFLVYGFSYYQTIYSGSYNIHFYTPIKIYSNEALIILITNIFFGYLIYKIIPKKLVGQAIEDRKNQNLAVAILFYLSVGLYLLSFYSILTLISLALAIILIANYKISNWVIISLIPLSAYTLVINNDRYSIIFVFMMLFIPKIRKFGLPLVLLCLMAGLFFMVFILQPVRYGINPLSVFGQYDFVYSISKHLEGNYTAAYTGLYIYPSFLEIISQQIPFARSIFGFGDWADISSHRLLPAAYDAGIRVGTNNTLNLSVGGVAIAVCSVILLRFCIRIKASLNFGYCLVWYLFSFAPYTFRRSVSATFFDIFLILFLIIFFQLIIFLFQQIGRNVVLVEAAEKN